MHIHTLVPRRFGRRSPARRSVLPVSRYLDADFDRLFDQLTRGFGLGPAVEAPVFQPNVDVSETEHQIVIAAELPGLEEKDFEVNVEGDVLTIKGEKREERVEEESEKAVRRVEAAYGAFERSFRLPDEIDPEKIRASFRNGVLRVTIEKPQEEASQARVIEVMSE